jgi:hypothetical protein
MLAGASAGGKQHLSSLIAKELFHQVFASSTLLSL